jgi:ketosteroid isomerase-like protein
MAFGDVIRKMVAAVEAGDGKGVAGCFTPDGVYHDVFYGSFQGEAIADLIENYFHRDATNFKWDIHDPVEGNGIGYARYVFSYESTLDASKGKRAIFEGVAVCKVRDGLIAEYHEVANAATGLHCIGFPPERLSKFIGKQADELKGRAESKAHFG